MMQTLTLAACLLAAPEPQAEPPKGWVVEMRGYTYHRQAEPRRWVVEVRGFTKHTQAKPQQWIIEWRFVHPAQPKQVEKGTISSIYVDDLRAFIKQLNRQTVGAIEAVEWIYVEDLSAFYQQLKRRQP